MPDSEEIEHITDHQKKVHRPFFLTILSTAYLVYAGIVSLIFLVAVWRNAWFTEVLNDYFRNVNLSYTSVLIFSVTALIIHLISFAGTIMMLKMKSIGFYLFFTSIIVIIFAPHLMGYGNWFASGIFFILLLLFVAFFRKMR